MVSLEMNWYQNGGFSNWQWAKCLLLVSDQRTSLSFGRPFAMAFLCKSKDDFKTLFIFNVAARRLQTPIQPSYTILSLQLKEESILIIFPLLVLFCSTVRAILVSNSWIPTVIYRNVARKACCIKRGVISHYFCKQSIICCK